MLYAFTLLLAQAEQQGQNQEPAPFNPLQSPIALFLALGLMFVFIVLLPQQRREKRQREALMSQLKKNDEVVTAAGIIGVVTNIKEGADEVTLKIDDNAKIRVLRSTIVRIVSKENKEGA